MCRITALLPEDLGALMECRSPEVSLRQACFKDSVTEQCLTTPGELLVGFVCLGFETQAIVWAAPGMPDGQIELQHIHFRTIVGASRKNRFSCAPLLSSSAQNGQASGEAPR